MLRPLTPAGPVRRLGSRRRWGHTASMPVPRLAAAGRQPPGELARPFQAVPALSRGGRFGLCRHRRPNSFMLQYLLPARITWSRTSMPMMLPASMRRAVRATSSPLGDGSPDGWLWKRTTAVARWAAAVRKTSAGVHEARVDDPAREDRGPQDPVLRVHADDPELLDGVRPVVGEQVARDLAGRPQPRPFGRRPRQRAAAQLDGGRDHSGPERRHAVDSGEIVGALVTAASAPRRIARGRRRRPGGRCGPRGSSGARHR